MRTEVNGTNYITTIRAVMEEMNLTQKKFAELVGVDQTTVSQWLRGNKKPSYDNILSICVNLDISPNELFGF